MSPALALERKQLTLSDVALDPSTGSFAGYASVFGGVDAYGDTIVAGAYTATIPKYLTDGFIGWGHDDRTPVAYPTVAREDEHGLWIEATFHSTGLAQQARLIASERLLAGKRVGLSIGYYPVKAESNPDGTRRLLQIDLVETSLVMIPADDAARVASVKAAEAKPFPNEHACRLRDPGAFQPDSFRRISRAHEGKDYSVIVGRLKGETTMTEQAYRYAKDTWSAAAARAHCDSHDGASFEPATGKAADADEGLDGVPGSYEALAAAIEAAYLTDAAHRAAVIATFGDTVIVEIPPETDDAPEAYFRVPYVVEADGSVTLGASTPVSAEATSRPAATARERARLAEDASRRAVESSWAVQFAHVESATKAALTALEAIHVRALAQSRFDAKEGRQLSAATRAKLLQVLDAEDALGAAFAVIRQLLTETEPAPKGWSAVVSLRALESRLRLNGQLPAEGGS